MKRLIIVFSIALFALPVFADDMDGTGHHRGRDPFAAEMREILGEYRDRSPASLTFGEMEELAAMLSVPMQQQAYVRKSAAMSFFMPGAGQFKNGDALAGALFLTADLAIVAGTAVGLYFLLPAELQSLDYFNSTYDEIETAWETAAANASFANSWQFWGVATGGMLLKHVVGTFSARHAGRLAMENIESGKVTFEPHAGFFMGHHGPGFGFSMKY